MVTFHYCWQGCFELLRRTINLLLLLREAWLGCFLLKKLFLMMLTSWIQHYENMGEAEAQRAPSSAAFPVCCIQRGHLPASQHPQARVSWCQTTFPSLPAVSQMFLLRISVSGAAIQTCWQLPYGDTVSLCFCKAQKGSLVFDNGCYTKSVLAKPPACCVSLCC